MAEFTKCSLANRPISVWRAFALLIVGQLLLGLASCAYPDGTRTTTGSGGVPIEYDIAGSGDTALIFVHGWSCDRSYWREQMSVFARDYRVVAVDLGGHGASPANRDDWSIESFGQDVAAVAAGVDADHVVLIGHSMGGRVVLDAAKRLGERLAGIIAVDTLKSVSTRPVSAERAAEMFTTSPEEFRTRMEALVRRAFFTDDTPAELVDQIAKDMAAGDPVVGGKAGIAHATYDVGAALRELDGVALILINADHGPTDGAALEAAHPGSRVVIIPDSGHFLMLERPQAFNAALESELDRLFDSGFRRF